MTGVHITLVSGLIDMFRWDSLLTAARTDPAGLGALATRYTDWVLQIFRAFADCDAPVIMVHDDVFWTTGPLIHPYWYRECVFPNYRRMLAPLHEAGKKIAYTSDGDYTIFIPEIVEAVVDGFIMEPLTDMAVIKERYGKTHFFIGNADTRILLDVSREAIRAEVERCIALGRDCPGYFLAVGNHIPAIMPIESALYYNECSQEMMMR